MPFLYNCLWNCLTSFKYVSSFLTVYRRRPNPLGKSLSNSLSTSQHCGRNFPTQDKCSWECSIFQIWCVYTQIKVNCIIVCSFVSTQPWHERLASVFERPMVAAGATIALNHTGPKMQLKRLDGQRGRFTHSLPHLLDFSLRSSTKCIFTVFFLSRSDHISWSVEQKHCKAVFFSIVCVFIPCIGRYQVFFASRCLCAFPFPLLFIFSKCREGTSYADSHREYAFQLFLRLQPLHMNAAPSCNCCCTVFFKQNFVCLCTFWHTGWC